MLVASRIWRYRFSLLEAGCRPQTAIVAIKGVFLALGIMACFLLLPDRYIERCCTHRGKGLIILGSMPPLCLSRFSFLKDSEEEIQPLTWTLVLETAGCSIHNIASDSRVLCIWSVALIRRSTQIFPDYLDHREWNLYVNIGFYSKSTNTIPVTISLTFRNNRIDYDCD
jgi:hypothetical protein